ncbi:DegT/DnrJ/EryC1/StrS family aminotransferase [Candidatus Woesearchaeota archaeon]|nr:DegT/DnrJ/EryC1/StrS family aminotransferase [Candidatus Woesearchaeota archaeon]
MKDKIPLCKIDTGEEELHLIKEVLESGWLAHGPKVKKFEEDFAKFIGVPHAIALNSCASALQAALMAYEFQKGTEVILPSFTFPASANAIHNAGLKPVFAEIREDTFNLDVGDLERRINQNTVAIMPVHFAGQSCEMDTIMELAKKNDIVVIEDSAEAIGSTYNGIKTGAFGVGCFSFYPTKNLTTGEGGMVTTSDKEIAEKVKAIRGHGIGTGAYEREKMTTPWIRVTTTEGYNFRMCEPLAAIGIAQLRKLKEMNIKRRENSQYLNDRLDGIEEISIPVELPNAIHTYQMYVIKLDEKVDRNSFVTKLRERGIEASVHFYPAVHLHDFYQSRFGYREGDLPITEMVSKKVVTLPMFPSLTKDQLDRIVDGVKSSLTDSYKK